MKPPEEKLAMIASWMEPAQCERLNTAAALHEDEVLVQLGDSRRFCLFRLTGSARRIRALSAKQELKGLAEALTGVRILQFVGK